MPENDFSLDDRHWPLVIYRVRGQLRGEVFERYLRSYEVLLSRKEQYVIVFDASQGKALEVAELKAHAAWIRVNQERLGRYNVGIAFVISSALVRGALAAILWLQPMPSPHTVVPSFDEALLWAMAQAQASGLVLPDSVATLRSSRRPS